MDITIEKVQSAIDKLRFSFPYSAEDWAKNLYMENYHCHKDFSNLNVIDCAESIENYAERTKEYGAKCLFSGEHGSQGNQFHVYKIAEQNGLKYRHSCEAYWVRSRHEKDRTNCHMMIVAKNPEGRKDLNYILSVAQESGYYYQPRIDLNLLLSVNPDNFIVTSACFTAGNKVLTKNGYKPIEEIVVGDQVMNRYGNWETVNYPTSRNYSGKGYEIQVEGNENPIVCTSNHKFLTTSITDIGNQNLTPKWKEAEEIHKRYLKGGRSRSILLKPINHRYKNKVVISKYKWVYKITDKSIQNPRKILLPEKIEITPELCMFFGALIGNGSISIKINPKIDLVINEKYFKTCWKQFIDPVQSQLSIKFNVRKVGKIFYISSSSRDFVEFIYYVFGECDAKTKHIPEFCYNISEQHNLSLLYGMLMTDGCLSQHAGGKIGGRQYKTGRLSYTTVSKELKDNFINLCEALHLKSTWTKRIEETNSGLIHSESPQYMLQISSKHFCGINKENLTFQALLEAVDKIRKDSHWKPYVKLGDCWYKKQKIKSIKPIELNETVYCLNDDSHSFVVNNVVAHNCIAGWKYEDADEIWLEIAKHFGGNFFIEVQNHNTEKQKELNAHLVEFAKENNLQLICGLDSHYVLEENRVKREWIQKYKKIEYDSLEEGWFMDYPDTAEVIRRFEQQGVLSESAILEAILNTNIFVNECEEIVFDRHFKIPNIYPELDYEGRVKKLKQIVTQEYKKDPNKSKEKKEGIRWEVNQYVESGTVDYPLMSKAIVDLAVGKYSGVLTKTSRGSAASFFTNNLMHLTTVDRFSAEVPIYPERFLTKERILSGAMPDCDLNLQDPKPFVSATRELLGEHSCYPMLAISKLQEKAAWKLYAGSQNIEASVANSVSKSLDAYNDAIKHSDGSKEIRIEDYVPAEFLDIYKESKSYQGITIGATPHPCGNLVFDGDIRREIGLMSVKSESKKERTLVAAVEGKYLDEFGYVKEDFLIVDTVALTEKLFQSIDQPTPSFTELKEMVKGDKATWDIYAKGITCCVNQCEQEGTRKKAMKYKPQTIGELAAFIAGVRPGFASLINNFLNRRPYTTGEPKIDKLLEDSSHYLLYQESIMKVLGFLGLEMGETYQTIKAISKKKLKGQMKEDLMKKLRDSWMKEFGNLDNFEKVWQVINDAAAYSFNSCVAGDTKLFAFGRNGKYQPTVEEMYRIMNDSSYAKETGHHSLHGKYQRIGYPTAHSLSEEDGRIRKNSIIDIIPKGVKPIYRVQTECGAYVDCTLDHKFPTPAGKKKRLDELMVGDELIVRGDYQHDYFDSSLTNGNYRKNTPKKGEMGFKRKPNGQSAMFKRKHERMVEQREPCEICGKPYDSESRFELHHKNHNRKNNAPGNLQWLCVSCHKKQHYKKGRTKAGEKGYPAETSPIISIEYLRDDMTYDIIMDDPNHTFVTESGLVVCNCHAYSMAGDSLYNAWFKAHHTAKFYEVAIGHYQEKDKKDKIDALIREAMEFYGYEYGDYRFGVDNRKVTVDEASKTIYPNLSSVKGIGEKVAEELYQMASEKPKSFYEIEKLISQSSINKTVMEKLIKLDYFKQFARRNKLLEFHKFYTLFGKAKSVKFKKIDDNGYSRELFIPYGKVSETQVSKIDIDECIKHYWDSLPDMLTQPEDAIRWEFEITGIVSYTNSDIPENVYFVTDIECKKKLGIASLYAPNDGEKRTVKFWISNFNSHPFEMGDFLTVPYFDQKQVREFTGETDPVTGKRVYAAVPGKYENFLGPYTVHKEVII